MARIELTVDGDRVSDEVEPRMLACLEQKVGDAGAAGQAAAAEAAADEAVPVADPGPEDRMDNMRKLTSPATEPTRVPPRNVNSTLARPSCR